MSLVPVCPQHPWIGNESKCRHVTVSTGFPGAVSLAGPCVPIGPRESVASARAYYMQLSKLPLSVLLAEGACYRWRPSPYSEERGSKGCHPHNSLCHSTLLKYAGPVCWETDRLNPCHPKERQLQENRFHNPLNLDLGHWAVRDLLPLWLFSGCDLDGPTH